MTSNKEEKKATTSSDDTKPPTLTHLPTGLLNLWQSRDHADIAVHVEDKDILCHKVVLVAASPYFEAMFKSGMKEAMSSKIELREMTAGTFELVLEFVYTGKDVITSENVSALLEASSLLQIQALFERCEDLLLNNISTNDCIEIWRLTSVFNSEKIMKKAFQFILANFTTLTEQDNFKGLSVDELMEIVRDDRLKTPSEQNVVQAVLDWGRSNNEREGDVGNLFVTLRLCQLSPEYLYTMKTYFTTTIDNEIARRSIDEAIELRLVPYKKQKTSSCFVRYRHCNKVEEVLVLLGSSYLFAFCFVQEKWFTLDEINDLFEVPLSGAMCSYEGNIFITGGWLSPRSVFEYKVTNDKWSKLRSLCVGRNSHAMVATSDALFVLGGERDILPDISRPDNSETLSSVETYSFVTQKWEKCGN